MRGSCTCRTRTISPHFRQTGRLGAVPDRLLESTPRIRADRLILGEIRGVEAINTEHPGSISTIRADSPKLALERMAMMVLRAGLNQTLSNVVDYATCTIDLIVQFGRHGGERGMVQVYMPALEEEPR